MLEEPLTTEKLLEQWREATRAAELAERLAKLADETAARADASSVAADEIARYAERAAKAADRAARSARQAADRARTFSESNRAGNLADANQTVVEARVEEQAAGARYHEAERQARERNDR
jgi:hypothetical protein